MNRRLDPVSAIRYTFASQAIRGVTIQDSDTFGPPSVPSVIASICHSSLLNSVEQLLETLKGIATLEDNWDGYGALKISDEAISSTREIIGRGYSAPPVDLSPCANGTLAIEWSKQGKTAYVEVGKTLVSGYVNADTAGTYYLKLGTSEAPTALPAVVNALLSPSENVSQPVTQLRYVHQFAGADD